MSRRSRVHLDAGDERELALARGVAPEECSALAGSHRTACGRPCVQAAIVTLDRGALTCRACLRLADRCAPPPAAPEPTPWEAGPSHPVAPQRWEAPGPRLVRDSIAGDDRHRHPGWPTLDAALRDWWEIGHRSVVRSGWTGEGAEELGDRALIERRARVMPVSRALALAAAGGHEFAGGAGGGALALGVAECVEIVAHYQAGRSAEDIADRLSSEAEPVTARQVRIVWRRMRRVVGEDLARRSLLATPPLPQRESKKESSMRLPRGYDLDGWKQIADHIGVADSTARRYVARSADPLPVRRYLGALIARRADLDAWMARQVGGGEVTGGG